MPPPSDWAPERVSLAAFARPRLGRSALDIVTSVVPYLAASVAMYLSLGISYLLTLALVLPTAGFLVRTFVVFHDCAHGSLFVSKRANRYVGRVLGFFVLAPLERWRHDHAVHHATSGDLERRGVGDIVTLTVCRVPGPQPAGPARPTGLIRNPLVMFGLGPVMAMMIGPRIPTRAQRPRMRHSVLGLDAVLAVVVGLLCWLIGWAAFLLVWAPPAMIAGAAGIWMFYVQHQFEDAYWQSPADWDYADAALRGSSYLRLPSRPAVLHRQHRPASRAPSQRPHPQLQPSARSRGKPALRPGPDAVVARRPGRDSPQTLG